MTVTCSNDQPLVGVLWYVFPGALSLNLLCHPVCIVSLGEVEAELLHTYSRLDPYDTLILCVRLAVLTAVTLTVPIVLFPVSPILSHTHTYAAFHSKWEVGNSQLRGQP